MIVHVKQGGPQIAPFLKISFPQFSFPSIKRCILLAECYGKRGGVLHPEGEVRDDAVAPIGCGRERGGDCTEIIPSLCISSPPTRAQPTLASAYPPLVHFLLQDLETASRILIMHHLHVLCPPGLVLLVPLLEVPIVRLPRLQSIHWSPLLVRVIPHIQTPVVSMRCQGGAIREEMVPMGG